MKKTILIGLLLCNLNSQIKANSSTQTKEIINLIAKVGGFAAAYATYKHLNQKDVEKFLKSIDSNAPQEGVTSASKLIRFFCAALAGIFTYDILTPR